jgi:alkylation response protein AidB-like acyl-CoA dehydrogenase
MAKLKSTKVADETIYSCLQMLGGYGYMEEYPLARLLRDSRLNNRNSEIPCRRYCQK